MKKGNRILIDTNAILEAHRLRFWPALCGYFSMTTVTECVTECATGNQRRDCPIPVDIDRLTSTIQIGEITHETLFALYQQSQGASENLDEGEKHLLAYALAQPDAYLICSPDKACMRVANQLGLLDRLVSLETLARKAGIPKAAYRTQFTEKWHAAYRTQLVLGEI